MTIVATAYQQQTGKLHLASDTIGIYSSGRISHNTSKIYVANLPIALAVGIAGSAWVGTAVMGAFRMLEAGEEFEFDSAECLMLAFNDAFVEFRDSIPTTDKSEYQYQAVFVDYDREIPLYGSFTGYGDGGVDMNGDIAIGSGADIYQGAYQACKIHTDSPLVSMMRAMCITTEESANCGGNIDLLSVDVNTGTITRSDMAPDEIRKSWIKQVS